MSGDQEITILLAARHDAFRDDFAAALADEGFKVTCTDSGEDVVKALTQGPTHRVVIVHDDLNDIGGIDAIYRSNVELSETAYRPLLFLMSAVEQDDELLSLMRKRGVADFLTYREAPDLLVDHINDRVFDQRRAAKRHSISLEVCARIGDTEIAAHTLDISETGLAIVLRGDSSLDKGSRVHIHFPGIEEDNLSCVAEVRWARQKKRLFGKRTHVGLEFMFGDDNERDQISSLIQRLKQISQIQHETLSPRHFFPG